MLSGHDSLTVLSKPPTNNQVKSTEILALACLVTGARYPHYYKVRETNLLKKISKEIGYVKHKNVLSAWFASFIGTKGSQAETDVSL